VARKIKKLRHFNNIFTTLFHM